MHYEGVCDLETVYEGVLYESDDVKWTNLPSLKIARTFHAAFYLQDRLYIVGGKSVPINQWFDSCEVYDFWRKIWSEGSHLPNALIFPISVEDPKGRFALILGRTNWDQNTKVVVFDGEVGFNEIATVELGSYVKQVIPTLQ